MRRMIRLSGSLIHFLRNDKIWFPMKKRNNIDYDHLSKKFATSLSLPLKIFTIKVQNPSKLIGPTFKEGK